MVEVVLPTPPFWLHIAMTFGAVRAQRLRFGDGSAAAAGQPDFGSAVSVVSQARFPGVDLVADIAREV